MAHGLLTAVGMRTHALALFVALAAGCGSAPPALQGDLTLNDPADQGKADSISGKQLRYTVDMFIGWGGGAQWGSGVEMSSLPGAATVRVTGPATVFQPRDNIEIKTVSNNWTEIKDLWIDMVMIPFARRVVQDQPYPKFKPISCGGMNYASRVLVDPTNEEIDLLGYKADTARSFKLADCGVAAADGDLQIALLPVAAYDWGRINGEYGYLMKASCAIGECPKLDMIAEGP